MNTQNLLEALVNEKLERYQKEAAQRRQLPRAPLRGRLARYLRYAAERLEPDFAAPPAPYQTRKEPA